MNIIENLLNSVEERPQEDTEVLLQVLSNDQTIEVLKGLMTSWFDIIEEMSTAYTSLERRVKILQEENDLLLQELQTRMIRGILVPKGATHVNVGPGATHDPNMFLRQNDQHKWSYWTILTWENELPQWGWNSFETNPEEVRYYIPISGC